MSIEPPQTWVRILPGQQFFCMSGCDNRAGMLTVPGGNADGVANAGDVVRLDIHTAQILQDAGVCEACDPAQALN